MGPKLLIGGVSVLAAAFVLALPGIFEGEPANEVDPIRFGPPPVAGVAAAIRVTSPPPRFPQPELPAPAPVAPAATPVIASGESGNPGPTAASGGRGDTARSPGEDLDVGGGASENAGDDTPDVTEGEGGGTDDDDGDPEETRNVEGDDGGEDDGDDDFDQSENAGDAGDDGEEDD